MIAVIAEKKLNISSLKMRARSAETKYKPPLTEVELKQYEQRLYSETGKGLVHPREFSEVYVRQAVEKLFIKKYGRLNER